LSLGDISGDDINDVLVCHFEGQSSLPHNAFVYYGGLNPDSAFDDWYRDIKPNIVQIGDINYDGAIDFGMSPLPLDHVNFYFGGNPFDTIPDFVISGVYSWIPKACDLDGDGGLEIPLATNINGGFVNIYRIDSLRDTVPEYIIPDTSRSFGNNLITGEFNGDGYWDLAVASYLNLDTCKIKFYWGGPSFDTIPDFIISSTLTLLGDKMLYIDDFNGDLFGDIFIAGTANEPYGIFYGGPDFDDKIDIIINPARVGGGYFGIDSYDIAGDINNDGYTDIILGHAASIAALYEAHIFLGGPTTDTIRYSDIYIENSMIPGSQAYFGDEVAGIGDFNGDGIDDFAVRSQTASGGINWWGEVNFFAGWDDSHTDVPYEYERTLPNDFMLKQNFPNPFNATTTISFEIPRGDRISLSIYDITGRKVRTLIEHELHAGSYIVRWNGRNDNGEEISSGVYLCRLEGVGCNETMKVILLK